MLAFCPAPLFHHLIIVSFFTLTGIGAKSWSQLFLRLAITPYNTTDRTTSSKATHADGVKNLQTHA
jgi:hypothetical protein